MHWLIILGSVLAATGLVATASWWSKPFASKTSGTKTLVARPLSPKRASEIADEHLRATEFAEFPAPQKY